MIFDLYPYSKPFNMLISIKVLRPVKLRLTVFDRNSKRIYINRRLRMDKDGKVLVKLPIVPDELTTEIVNENSSDRTDYFTINEIKVLPDTKCPISLSEGDKNFIRFIKWFATQVENLEAGEKGTLYQSEGFSILYLDTIKDNGVEITTPERIERDTGIIEISKKAIKDFTVPMLIVVSLHEYAHVYKNPEYGKEVTNEITADLIAVHIALNIGFDPFEVVNCFKAIFSKKDTDLNRRRMGAIEEFIDIFKKTEKERCNCNTCKTKES